MEEQQNEAVTEEITEQEPTEQAETVNDPTSEETTSEESTPEQVETVDSTENETVINPIAEETNYSVYATDEYSIELIHQITLGDILTSTLVSILIIVVLLNRLIGGR